jgi:hypothetical protein
MVVAYPSLEEAPSVVETPLEARALGRTQQALLEVVRSVRNLRDEDDVQCVAFLAGELGLLHPTPFYFSHAGGGRGQAPYSLILQGALRDLLTRHGLGWDAGGLRVHVAIPSARADSIVIGEALSWLGALSSAERKLLMQTTLDLRRGGVHLLARGAEILFRRTVARLLGAVEGAEDIERRLSAVRRQLSLI